MGHAYLASPPTTFSYRGVAPSCINQISLSSRWLCPLRHHWVETTPRAVIASVAGSVGDGAAKYSLAYRSPDTIIGMPPSARTRRTSLMPEMSRLVVEK